MSKLKASKILQQQQLLQQVEQNSQSQQTQLPSAKNKSAGMIFRFYYSYGWIEFDVFRSI
jgi:hypothetical protein